MPLGEVVRRAGTLGFALVREEEAEVSSVSGRSVASESNSSRLILRGEVHVDFTSVWVVQMVVVAGEAAPRLRFREEGGGVKMSSMSGVAEEDTSSADISSCFTSTVLS